MSSNSRNTIDWVYCNGLGESDPKNVTDSDKLTALKFDKTGNYLALGDKAGRVIVFKHLEGKKSRVEDYDYFSEFQSHES
jgi:serine/threonine-protein phosphatase 2A regulatory subunit B